MNKLKSIFFTGLVGLALSAPIYATSAAYLHALENVQLQASILKLPGKTVLLIPSDHLFELNTANLTQKGMDLLGDAASIINGYPNANIEITANTDPLGNNIRFQNKTLSDAQAVTVAGFLWKSGVKSNTKRLVTYHGVNARSPIASNKTLVGMTINRRIQINIVPIKKRVINSRVTQPITPIRYHK